MSVARLALAPGLMLGVVLLLAGCGGNPSYREWTASNHTPNIAFDECTEEVDSIMRLRGYPYRPLPETPQYRYRKEILSQCMRRKGYEPD
ncbi:hypothetical protein [Azospirillum thermophilum]|uniref:Lipoprotein n=1 Tax=Azospirillum thermophilum TaxID=2202148 RepID=A0A2S2CWW2_9PROT|nr:hypothetical protein [Azospirillum thermophilum]AWK88976.1 hypothetical protein DEW08_23375 [Azospirillum thermophilum]